MKGRTQTNSRLNVFIFFMKKNNNNNLGYFDWGYFFLHSISFESFILGFMTKNLAFHIFTCVFMVQSSKSKIYPEGFINMCKKQKDMSSASFNILCNITDLNF